MDRTSAYRNFRQMAHQSSEQAGPAVNAVGARQQPTLSASCKLDPGRSVTLQAREASLLRITRGRVWLTFNPAREEPSARLGDHFLGRGESLSLAAGEAVVMESYGLADAPSAYYCWEAAAASKALVTLTSSGWRAGGLRLLLDLRLALGSLARGLATAKTGMQTNFATVFVAASAYRKDTARTFKPPSGNTCAHCNSR